MPRRTRGFFIVFMIAYLPEYSSYFYRAKNNGKFKTRSKSAEKADPGGGYSRIPV